MTLDDRKMVVPTCAMFNRRKFGNDFSGATVARGTAVSPK
jgi:hypothetical protein